VGQQRKVFFFTGSSRSW